MRRKILASIFVALLLLTSCKEDTSLDFLPEECRTYNSLSHLMSEDMFDSIGGISKKNYRDVLIDTKRFVIKKDIQEEEFDFSGIQCFQNVEEIHFEGASIKNIDATAELRKVTKVAVINTNIQDIKALENKALISSIDLEGNNNLQSIDGIQNMTSLRELRLSNNGIVDIDPVYSLEKLEYLDLSNNEIIDIESISQLKNLRSLNLSNNMINLEGDYDFSELDKLEILNLSSNNIKNIDQLFGANSLKELYISSNDLGNGSMNFEPLADMSQLSILVLKNNNISSVTGLSGGLISSLQYLDLSSNYIENVYPLYEYENIKSLNLENNSLNDLIGIGALDSVSNLNLENNDITDFCPVLDIKSVTNLQLSHNNISSTSCIEGSEHLQRIDLSYNNISVLSGISNMTNLEELILRKDDDETNIITKIENSFNNVNNLNMTTLTLDMEIGSELRIYNSFNELQAYSTLELSNMNIVSIDNNSFNNTLTGTVNLGNNRLTDIDCIGNLKKVEQLNISNNAILDFSVLDGNKNEGLKSLTKIDASYNIDSNVSLRNAFNNLPNIEEIDIYSSNIGYVSDSFNKIGSSTPTQTSSLKLDISDNAIVEFKDSITENYITVLDMYGIGSISTPMLIEGSFNDMYVYNGNLSFNNLNIDHVESSFKNLTINQANFSNSNINSVSNSFVSSQFITELVISENNLVDISFAEEIQYAETIDLSSNLAKQLPDFGKIDGLTSLFLQNNAIDNIDEFNDLITLSYVDLSDNNIATTSSGLSGMDALTVLKLNNNKLEDEIIKKINNENFPIITEIYMNNAIASSVLVERFVDLGSLNILEIAGSTNVVEVKYSFTELPKLSKFIVDFSSEEMVISNSFNNIGIINSSVEINFAYMNIMSIEESFRNANISSLNLSNQTNALEIDENTFFGSRIGDLNLSGLDIENILFLVDITYVSKLDLSSNKLTGDFAFIDSLLRVENIDLSDNYIKNITPGGELDVIIIDISGNEVSNLGFARNMKNLEQLYANDNLITLLSGFNHDNLKVLELSDNAIVEIQDSLCNMANLDLLKIDFESLKIITRSFVGLPVLDEINDTSIGNFDFNLMLLNPENIDNSFNLMNINKLTIYDSPKINTSFIGIEVIKISSASYEDFNFIGDYHESLLEIDASNNKGFHIKEFNFGVFNKIEIIDLSNTGTTEILGLFNSTDNPNLKTVRLTNNNIVSIMDSFNNLTELGSTGEVLVIQSNSSLLIDNSFNGAINLKAIQLGANSDGTISLSGFNNTDLSETDFISLTNIVKMSGFENSKIRNIRVNSSTVDVLSNINDLALEIVIFDKIAQMDASYVENFENLQEIRVNYLEDEGTENLNWLDIKIIDNLEILAVNRKFTDSAVYKIASKNSYKQLALDPTADEKVVDRVKDAVDIYVDDELTSVYYDETTREIEEEKSILLAEQGYTGDDFEKELFKQMNSEETLNEISVRTTAKKDAEKDIRKGLYFHV